MYHRRQVIKDTSKLNIIPDWLILNSKTIFNLNIKNLQLSEGSN